MKNFDLENNDKIRSGFTVPEHYFEQFEAKMMQQISIQKTTVNEVKVVSLFYRKQVWMSSIAALILLAIAIPVYFNMAKENNIESHSIENYLADQQHVYENEIIEHLSEEDINALENSLSASTNENDAIENYLSESEHLDYILNE
ncbi:hypothetical protein [Flavobacterium sp.]|uniref:hypothetical protein n=1 Tax=Flavobacterium sp. TaxID=239 RepID=UPI0037BFC577